MPLHPLPCWILQPGIENLVVEFNPPTSSLGQHEEDQLHLDAGFRKKKGLRDDIDAADHLWMSVGTAQVAMPRGGSSHNIRQKDINALTQLGCDPEVLRQPGPKRDQVRHLCEVLNEGWHRVVGCGGNLQVKHIYLILLPCSLWGRIFFRRFYIMELPCKP